MLPQPAPVGFPFGMNEPAQLPHRTAPMKNAVIIGSAWAAGHAYPPRLRQALGRRVRLHPLTIDASEWTGHRDVLADAHIVLSSWGMVPLRADVLAAMPRLEAVFHAAGTVKSFATEDSTQRGVTICSAADANAIPVAEYALGAILLALKNFWSFQRTMQIADDPHAGVAVAGTFRSCVGLVSLGAIGRRVASLLSRHNVKVLVHDPRMTSAEAAVPGVELVPLRELFGRSDVVSLHTPWLPETEKMVGAALLRSMKRGATLVNTARGALIDEDALCAVLRERTDLTAVLDVTWPEPPAPDSPLRSLPNVILTPHIAGSMGAEVARMGLWMSAEMLRHIRGRPLRHKIDPTALASMA